MMQGNGNPVANAMGPTTAPIGQAAPQASTLQAPAQAPQAPQMIAPPRPVQMTPAAQQQPAQPTQQAYAQPQQQPQYGQQQPSFQDMMQFFQQMQQRGYAPQPSPAQGFAARMQAQQQNPMQSLARPPAYQQQPVPMTQPAQAYASQHPAAQMHPVSAMPVQTQVTPADRAIAAPSGQSNPVAAGLGPQPMTQHGGLAMSDATAKVLTEHSLADDFLEHMRPYSYRYKDPHMEPRVQPTGGEYLGVMAQDLERIPRLGPQIVVNTPQGKMVDQKTALSATMAGLARVHERVRALELDAMKGRK